MRRTRAVAIAPVVLLATAVGSVPESAANDRLPQRLRPGFEVARREVRKYIDYLLVKVWRPRVRELLTREEDVAARRAKVDALVDEAVHLLLPEAKRLMGDAVFGTGTTHLRITMPELRRAALAARAPAPLDPGGTTRAAIEAAGNVAERALNDRLEQALLEAMEDHVQRRVEGAAGLPVLGRPRRIFRPLPERWERTYRKVARQEVHRFVYWWLRKRRRLWLIHMATTMSRPAIDRARHLGPVWRLISGVSAEAWAQNRLRIDLRWGRLRWEIDRRRIRRRMDQDLALGTWALTRLVKELLAPETMEAIRTHLDRRLREELARGPLREQAERYPDTAGELQRRMQRLKREVDPILDRAMDHVPLPDHMRDLAREHGRRFMREELEGPLHEAIRRQAAPFVAARRARELLGEWVARALAGFDPGPRSGEAHRRAARSHVLGEVVPRLREEIAQALRDHEDKPPGAERVTRVVERFRLREAILREAERRLSQRSREAAR